VDYADSPEQAALREVVRDFCARHAASAGVLASGTPAASVWKRLAGELGLTGLAIGERYGGTGAGLAEVAVAAQELGRVLLPVPYLSTAVAGAVLGEGDPEVAAEFLPGLASGELTAAFALDAELTVRDAAAPDVAGRDLSAQDVTVRNITARGDGLPGRAPVPDQALVPGYSGVPGRALISGHARHVLDGPEAGVFLARVANGALFAVRAQDAIVEPTGTLDATRSQSAVTFRDSPARAVGLNAVRAESLLRALLAAESAAAAQRCLEVTVAYLQARRQFGRVIGSFQALKHRCADLAVEVTAAQATAAAAVSAATALGTTTPASTASAIGASGGPAELQVTAALAKVYCADAFWHVAAEMVQLHGGIGFTWEHGAHRYLKRAKTNQLVLGTRGELRRLIADLAGLGRP
jgi:alkylation response protein AidB-like acyl-CoA dehydrogenase